MLQVWMYWSCLAAVEGTGCSFGGSKSKSKPRWSYPAAPPLGRQTHLTHSSLLWLAVVQITAAVVWMAFFKQADTESRCQDEAGGVCV